MAIAKFKKLQLVAHNTLRETLLEELQQIGGVHILDWQEESELAEEQPPQQPLASRVQAETSLNKIDHCLKFIKPFEPSIGFMEKLAQGKPQVNLDQLKKLGSDFDLDNVYQQCVELEHKLHDLHQQSQLLQSQLTEMHPWKSLDISFEELRETRTTIACFIKIPQEQAENLYNHMEECISQEASVHRISQHGDFHYLIIIILKQDKVLLEKCIIDFDAEQVKVPSIALSPGKIIRQTNDKLSKLNQDLQQLQEQSATMLRFKEDLEKLYDYYNNQKKQQELQNTLFSTHKTLVLEGWVCTTKVEELAQCLENNFQEIAINLRDPQEGEEPPIKLTNNKLVTPFEGITKLYGLPHSKELDPTPLLAPFFFIFFGLCLTDGGYGILLMLGSFWCLRKLLLGEGSRQMMKLFLMAGFATVLAGAITGGWFGDMIDLLPASFAAVKSFKNSMVLFDPIKDPLTFMALSLVLGFIQVCFGIVVEMYDNIKHKAWGSALLVQLPWLLLLLGCGVYGLEFSGTANPTIIALRKALTYSGAGALLILSPYEERNPLKRLGMGLLELYNIVAYMSDILSYSRLLALGLATGVIGMVVNKIAMLTTGVPVVGYVFMLLIMAGGHLFNLAINALGSFVHTSRLQFVEFFPKFFEGGGKPFAPFCWEEKFSINTKA